jgi:hypothetical protein
MLLEPLPTGVEKFFVNVDPFDHGALEQDIADLHRLGMVTAAVEEGDDLVEDKDVVTKWGADWRSCRQCAATALWL